jgi:hypothetical protein
MHKKYSKREESWTIVIVHSIKKTYRNIQSRQY